MDEDTIRRAFLDGADAAARAVADPAVAERWPEPSALARMSVGDLAAHLVRAVHTAETYLDAPAPPGGATLIDAGAYYGGMPALTDPGSDLNEAVLRRSAEGAAAGPRAIAAGVAECRDRLAARLPGEPGDRPVAVLGGLALTLSEYLRTRCIELAVHLDDLGVTPPESTTAVAVETLTAAARYRHGDLAVLRAMTRRERAGADVLRVV